MRKGLISLAALLILATTTARANLVTNGSFESGLDGWTNGDPTGIVADSVDPAYDGGAQASLGSYLSPGTLSQSLTLTANRSYLISFALQNLDTSFTNNSIDVTFGATSLLSLSNAPSDPSYQIYTFTETATSASLGLSFTAQNDNSVWLLDAVSVTPVSSIPVPTSPELFMFGLALLGLETWLKRRASESGLRRACALTADRDGPRP